MNPPLIDFLLVPDSASARRLRRQLAESGGCDGVVVGTWRELLELAASALLPTRDTEDWSQALDDALAQVDDAFWRRSLDVAPRETAQAVAAAYVELKAANTLLPLPALAADATCPARVAARYADLRRLDAALGDALPDPLALLRRVLAADPACAARHVRVAQCAGFPELAPAAQRLVDRLNELAAAPPDPAHLARLARLAGGAPRAAGHCALGSLQRGLFEPRQGAVAPDASVQWLGCRDYLEEVELAAGMIQRGLAEDPGLAPRDFALLLPDDYVYSLAVEEVFTRAGLPLSGLPSERWRRDLGREAVLLFLYCREAPAPAMARAACLTSPLMPWAREQGAAFAQAVMERLEPLPVPAEFDSDSSEMLRLIGGCDTSASSLAGALERYLRLLRAAPLLEAHLAAAREAGTGLVAWLRERGELDWQALRQRITPACLDADAEAQFSLEGVTVWRESQEAWRDARHLLVLGFNAGHYPVPPATSTVFTDDEWAPLSAALGLPLPTGAQALARHRARFRRQISAASETASFFVARRKANGDAQRVAENHLFLADALGCAQAADDLVLDVDDETQRATLRGLALAPPALARSPRLLEPGALCFGRDLLTLRLDARGAPKPESPSGLETLMVSPLAWLLRRMHCEPLAWQADRPDPLLLGTLAHEVFEHLFGPGQPLPDAHTLDTSVAALLDAAIRRHAAFLSTPQWLVERSNLAGALSRAAAAWCDALATLGASILGGELALEGRFHGIDVQGTTDLLLALGDDRVLVVDYKRSSSKGRREQMEKGFDSQAELYRQMLRTGGPRAADDAAIAQRLAGAREIGVVYYMLNDRTALTDARLAEAGWLPRWERIDANVSQHAIALIGQRIDAIRAGRLPRNGSDDRAHFEKSAGVKPYALDLSPLVTLFAQDGLGEGLA